MTGVAHTLSMDPWMDIDGVQVLQPFTDSADLQVGDVITYDPQDRSGKWRMHPIIEITSDSLGWYCRTKGINVPIADRERIRADWIKYVYIGQLIAK